jgi:hypothetical protein
LTRWIIDDLLLMRDAGVQVAEADFLEVYRRENTHLDFTFCEFCGAETFQQHLPDCRREFRNSSSAIHSGTKFCSGTEGLANKRVDLWHPSGGTGRRWPDEHCFPRCTVNRSDF